MKIKTKEQIENIRIGAKILAEFLENMKIFLKEGVSLIDLDKKAYEYIKKNNGIPAFKNFHGFPSSICTSVNEDIIHGIPSSYKLKNSDILTIDIGIIYNSMYADTAFTYCIGEVDEKVRKLVKTTEEALYLGIDQVKSGCRVGDIGFAIENHAKKYSYGIVREYTGHGVGIDLWEDPMIPNYGKKNFGPRLQENMVIAIEPMFNLGTDEVFVKKDQWTVSTKDQLPSAHFEHTILVKKDTFEILSKI